MTKSRSMRTTICIRFHFIMMRLKTGLFIHIAIRKKKTGLRLLKILMRVVGKRQEQK